ncbi:MAG: nitroreductase family protein [bacterium]
MNETMRTIFSRKSVRNYTGDSISKETLELLVKAGMAAPSARDKRPWEFIIIDDKEILEKLSQALPYAKMTAEAGHGIVVAGNLEKQNRPPDSPYWIMDCSAAVQNILLAAESLGLGTVWTAIYPNEERIEPVSRLLNLPENIAPLALIPIGKPKSSEGPKEKFNEAQIHWNKW